MADPSATGRRLVESVGILPQRLVPLATLLPLQVCVAAGILVGKSVHIPAVHSAAVGVVLATALVPRIRGMTLPQWAVLRLRYATGRRNRSRDTIIAEPFEAEMSDGSKIGFRWDGKTLLSLLQIDENPEAMTVLEPGMTVSGETLSIQLMADCLRQFDIALDSIDVISQGARSHGHSPIAAVYDAVLGPLPAIAHRSVWVALRFDPSLCADAVRRRGGGREGVLRTAATATRRVANRLIESGLRPRVLTSSEIIYAAAQLADGVNLHGVDETWSSCQHGHFQLKSYALKPTMLSTEGVGLLWTVPSYSTTVCISLRRDGPIGMVKIRGLARFDSYGPRDVHLGGLEKLSGRQLPALAATVPTAAPQAAVGHWVYGMGENAFDGLALPASGCGQVVGADAQGRAVALPLFGPHVGRVAICGGLHLAQQVLLRSLALGARVRVHTTRPGAWRVMVEQVGDRGLLWVADSGRGSIQAGSDRNYTVELFDGVVAHSVRIGVTVIELLAPGTALTAAFDATLELLDSSGDVVKVRTGAGSAVVTMVETEDESRFTRAPGGARR